LSAVAQILVLDVVFALDSIITAQGRAEHLPIIIKQWSSP
jgi:predicted tellurium resistance membrane protein TerC